MNALPAIRIAQLLLGVPMVLVGAWGFIVSPEPFALFFALLFLLFAEIAHWQHWRSQRTVRAERAKSPVRLRDLPRRVRSFRPLALVRAHPRTATLLGLWLLASTILLVALTLMFMIRINEIGAGLQGGTLSIPSAGAIRWGGFVPIALAAIALVLQARRARGARRAAAAAGLAFAACGAALVLRAASQPREFASIRLADGRQLAVLRRPFDIARLYQSVGPFGAYWRPVGMLGEESGRLILSRDGRWLAFERQGLLTQCFRLLPERVVPCDDRTAWISTDQDEESRGRSRAISKLTGIQSG